MYYCIEQMRREPSWWDALTKDDQHEIIAYYRSRDKRAGVERWYWDKENKPKGGGK